MDELSLIDHNEIMARLTLKQEVSASQVSMVQSGCDEGGGLPGACNLEVCPTERPKRTNDPPGGCLGSRLRASLLSWLRAWAAMHANRS